MSRCKMRTAEWRTGAEGGGGKREKACLAKTRAVETANVTAFGSVFERGQLPEGMETPVRMQ
jgi:hypothetical protein